MKVTLRNIRENLRPNQVGITKDFINFLQKNVPLVDDILITFVSKRNETITTGKHIYGSLFVFTTSRILIDILRTLAHEWAHEYQDLQKKSNPKLEVPSEPHANALAGYLVRKFIEENPEHEVEANKD